MLQAVLCKLPLGMFCFAQECIEEVLVMLCYEINVCNAIVQNELHQSRVL